MTKYSIVIPTYNHCDDLLRPCIDSIIKYTDLSTVEIIVVANGCVDETREYVESLKAQNYPVTLVWIDEAVGYTKATNAGIRVSKGEYVVLLNNDTELLPQSPNMWLAMLEAPFADSAVGLTAPLQLHDDYSDYDVLIFFCVMIRGEVFDKIGLLDEIYSPGGGEDIDFTIRANKAGYKSVQVTPTEFSPTKLTNVGSVPIWHKDNKTFVEIPEYTNWIVKRNGLINCKRYNKNIRLNIGGGGIPIPGFLTVDLYDKRAHVKMDVTKLDFDDNSVSEIVASHVFEHLNPYHSHDILTDWLRVLKPGGKLIMEMPNIEEVCKQFLTATKGERYGLLNVIYGSVNTTGEGGPDNITSPHLFGWWPESIYDHLANAGYVNISFGDEHFPHPPPNFRVEATKPESKGMTVDREKLKKQCYPVYKEIYEDNVYYILDNDITGKTVVDIGANAGFFSLRCVELGAKDIIAIEAQPTIYREELLPNVTGFPTIRPILAAAWHTGGLRLNIPNNSVNSVISNTGVGEETPTVTVAEIIQDILSDDLILKMDCEGSEYDILLNIDRPTIRRFEKIFIEVHSKDHHLYKDVGILHECLQNFGFRIVFSTPMYYYLADAAGNVIERTPIGYVEKWERT